MRGRGLARAAVPGFLLCLAGGCLDTPSDPGVPGSPDARSEGGDAASGADASIGLDEGLVARYAMEELIDGGGSASAPDATGGGDGTCTDPACPQVVVGHIGNAYQFDGNEDAVEVPTRPDFHTESGTVAAWVNVSQPAGVIAKPYGESDKNSWLLFVLGDGRIAFEVTSGIEYTDPELFRFGEWTHLAMTWSGTSSALFVNGVFIESGSPGTAFDDNPVVLGADRDGGAIVAPMEGMLDDVRLYERQLELAEVQALAEM